MGFKRKWQWDEDSDDEAVRELGNVMQLRNTATRSDD